MCILLNISYELNIWMLDLFMYCSIICAWHASPQQTTLPRITWDRIAIFSYYKLIVEKYKWNEFLLVYVY